MLASEAPIVFPALLFTEDEDYRSIPRAESLRAGYGFSMNRLIGREIVDMAGQRFRIRAFVNLERLGPKWKQWLESGFGGLLGFATYRFDLEVEALPPAPFEDTLRRVIAREKANCEAWVLKGGGADPPEYWRSLEACRSIEDILRHDRTLEVGLHPLPPPAAPR